MTLPRPPYDPELLPFLDLYLENRPELDIADIGAARQQVDAMCPTIESVIEGHDLEHIELTVPGPAGAPDITLSLIRRPGLTEPVPCVYNIHGGGMMFMNRFSEAGQFVLWIERFGVSVVTVEYRLAPEDPYPAPGEDCYAGLVWTAEHADVIGIDAGRILLFGASAGGGLAGSVALMARDRGGPALIGQVSPLGAPARSADLGGLPPAFLDVGSAEVFRDEAVQYAARIWAAGGQAELHVWSGGYHGYEQVKEARVTQASFAALYNWMGRILLP
jgi:acetyl esterase/lipase